MESVKSLGRFVGPPLIADLRCDGLDGVQNRHVLSLLPDVGHVPRLVGHSAPGHGGRANSASFRR